MTGKKTIIRKMKFVGIGLFYDEKLWGLVYFLEISLWGLDFFTIFAA